MFKINKFFSDVILSTTAHTCFIDMSIIFDMFFISVHVHSSSFFSFKIETNVIKKSESIRLHDNLFRLFLFVCETSRRDVLLFNVLNKQLSFSFRSSSGS